MRRLLTLAMILLLGVAARPGAAQGDAPVETLLARAESAVAQAEATQDPEAREALLDEAIAAYSAILEKGVANASIHRNLGTVSMLKGDVGRAVASLRRADRLDPLDPRVADSLAAARAMVRSEVERGARARATDALFFWRGLIPRTALAWAALGGWIALWIGLTLRVSRRGPASALTGVGLVVCLLAGGSLAAERAVVVLSPAAVIVDDGVTGYRGPSEGLYEPSFAEPIRAGVEGAVLEQREGWVRLRLRSGAETWVRADAIERV